MTTPTISNVSGTRATGQTLTITGTSMVDHDTTNWDSVFTENTASFEGANLAADGWDAGAYSLDTSVKLLGSKSATITKSGAGPSEPGNTHINGIFYKSDSSQAIVASFMRFYYRTDVSGGNGTYPDSFHKLVLNYPGSGNANVNLNYLTDFGDPFTGIHLDVVGQTGASGSFPAGAYRNARWYCIELEIGDPYHVWVNNALVITHDLNTAGHGAVDWDINWFYNLGSTAAGFQMKMNTDGMVLSSSRVRPSSVIEIGNNSDYALATKVYQDPETLSNTSNIVICDIAGLGAPPYYMWVTNNRNERSTAFNLSGEVQGSGSPARSMSSGKHVRRMMRRGR